MESHKGTQRNKERLRETENTKRDKEKYKEKQEEPERGIERQI